MPTIAEVRQKFPDYNDMSDTELAGALHKKFYSDLPEAEFNAKIGLGTAEPSPTAGLTQVPITGQPADDHGLARRQAMTPVEKAISPITEYPRHVREISTEGTHQISRGLGQLYEGALGSGWAGDTGKFAAGLGNVGFGAVGATFAPLSALYRSIVGQPIEDVTGIPREYPELIAQLATPGLGFTRSAALTEGVNALPGVGGFTRPTAGPGAAPPGPMIRPVEVNRPVVAEAAENLRDYAGAEVPRSITGGPVAQQTGERLSQVPYAGQPISEAIHATLPQQLERARDIAAAEYGSGTPANVAARVKAELQGAAAAETSTATEAATAADTAATANWERAKATREAAITAQEQQAAQRAQAAIGPDLHPLQMGETVINRVRGAHQSAITRKDQLYEVARNIPARISEGANSAAHSYIERSLERAGIHLQEVEAATASRGMMRTLDQFSEAARARAELAPVGQSMEEIDQVRKNLNFIASSASNPADQRAATHIINALDDWLVRSTRNHLMPGSDLRALPATLEARAANRDLMQRFGYNKRDDADRTINKIVRGEEDQHTGPVGVSNALIQGSDKAAPLFRRVTEATGRDPEVAQAIRSGTWNKLTRDADGNLLPASTVQKNVREYTAGPGRAVAGRVFDNSQRAFMRAHADTAVRADTARKVAAAEAKATVPKPTKIEPGEIQRLTEQVIGAKSDENIFGALRHYTEPKGDVKTLARVMGQLPAGQRGDIAAAFIRELGIAPGTRQFSLDHYASQWKRMTPQARAVMFGTSGQTVTALNDIATIADKLKNIRGRYGQPSKTAAQGTFIGGASALLGALFTHSPGAALTAAGVGVGGRIGAHLLARPAVGSSLKKYRAAVEIAERNASPTNLIAVERTQRNLANTARALGATLNK